MIPKGLLEPFGITKIYSGSRIRHPEGHVENWGPEDGRESPAEK